MTRLFYCGCCFDLWSHC